MLDAIWSTKLVANYTYLILIIFFGSATNATIQLKNARDKGIPFGFIDFMIALFIASFAGTMFAFFANFFGYTGDKVHFISGIGAFMGLGGLNKLTDTLISAVASKVKSDGPHN